MFFPLFLLIATKFKGKATAPSPLNEYPEVCVIMAAYNEERVIGEKLESVFNTNYPLDKIKVMVGSDASTDNTNSIVRMKSEKFPSIELVEFPGRTGKAGIINKLSSLATSEILIHTDANVLFTQHTIPELIKHFSDPEVHQVACNIKKVSPTDAGIAFQEKSYISLENKVKQMESDLWRIVIGVEGGGYAIRRESYEPVPPRFFMDDFFITMSVLEKGKKVIFEPNAICYEDVPTLASEEFKRKVRISIGNFQNLMRYKHLLWPIHSGLGFAFLSHKVLRWLTPFFIILCVISLGVLSFYSAQMLWALAFMGIFLSMPLIDKALQSLGIHLKPIRFASHFVSMNVALLKGFQKFAQGVSSNVWEPTKRNP